MTEIGEKEKLTILLAEYSSLRSEINARVSSSYQLLAIGTAAVVWLLQQPIDIKTVFGACMIGIGAVYWSNLVTFEIKNAGRRVRELEAEINKRAGEKLLLWESERGGLTPGYLWKAFTSLWRGNDQSSN